MIKLHKQNMPALTVYLPFIEDFVEFYEASGFCGREKFPTIDELNFLYGHGVITLDNFKTQHQEFVDQLTEHTSWRAQPNPCLKGDHIILSLSLTCSDDD